MPLVYSLVAFGLSYGLYEVLFPLYLDSIGVLLWDIGLVFTASSFFMALLGIYIGLKSDVLGRKFFISLSLLTAGISHLLIPVSTRLITLTILKILYDASIIVKNAVFAPFLYEKGRDNFITSYSRYVGLEFSTQAVGLMFGGTMAKLFGFTYTFWASSLALLSSLVFFSKIYSEVGAKHDISQGLVQIAHGGVFPRELKILAISGVFLALGGSLSHSFIMPLFFLKKFSLDMVQVSTLLTVHRLSLGVPMLFADKAIYKLSRRISERLMLMLLVCIEGVSVSASSLINNFYLASSVWLLHDPLGASFWLPLRNSLVQKYCRDGRRGSDFNKVSAVFQIGSIPASMLAGYLGGFNISYPFLVSGLITISSNFFLALL